MKLSTRKNLFLSLFMGILLVVFYSNVLAVKNAFLYIEKTEANGDGKILGVNGVIQYSYPNLNGGAFT